MHGLWLVVFLAPCTLGSNPAEVRTPLGTLRGSELTSRDGRRYFAFTSVPYASPPIGLRRFKAPAPAEPWTGILDASRPSPVCLQPKLTGKIGQEDCLYLNVYTPLTNGSLPVMVYIHGGGWRIGDPGPASSAKFFMDEDVVLVMPNYRLGPFGFLSTEDEEIPGNMGLKDMALALEWTETNIRAFGGDPKSITAFGLSAGGSSVHFLCSVLRTRGLLRGCISESGVGGAFWSLPRTGIARTNALKVANSLGCFGTSILRCLQDKSSDDILRTQKLLRFWTDEPSIIYSPVLEGRGGEGALITEWPTDSHFPWLTGVAANEGKIKAGDIRFKNQSYIDEFYTNKEEYLIRMLSLTEASRERAVKVYKRFFTENNFTVGIEKLYSEAYFVAPVLKELKRHQGPKYFFVFNNSEGRTYLEMAMGKKQNTTSPGSTHGDNLYFFFDTSHLFPGDYAPLSPKNTQLSKDLVKLWVNFAKYQNPSPSGSPEWKPFGDRNSFFYIGNSGFAMKNYENVQEIIDFWKEIF